MKKKLILPIFLVTLAITGCSAQNQSTTVSSEIETASNSNDLIDVSMDINTFFKDGQLGFYLETNLPNSTKLSANLNSIDNNYTANSGDIEVMDNKASFRFFNDKGNSLSAGDYELTVYVLASTKQNEEVLSVIGNEFKNLTGDLINNKNGISVEKTIPITVEEQKEIPTTNTTDVTTIYTDLFSKIINIKNHSSYLGSIKNAYEIWQEYREYVLVANYDFSKYNDKTILYIYGDKDKDLIYDIQIYPKNSSKNLSLENALDISYEYINSKFINQNYLFYKSESFYDEDSTFYSLSFKSNGNTIYSSFYVIIETKNNQVSTIRICDSLPKSINTSNYTFTQWSTDNKIMTIGIKENNIPTNTTESQKPLLYNDPLQQLYIDINSDMDYNEIISLVSKSGLEYKEHDVYNGKTIKIATEMGITPLKYADQGDYLKIDFDLDNNKNYIFSTLEYFNYNKEITAFQYVSGDYWDFHNGENQGYYLTDYNTNNSINNTSCILKDNKDEQLKYINEYRK